MFFNLIVLALIGGPLMLWGSRGKGYGLFSAFLNAVCVLAAGGVAFALWEPLALSFFLGMREDIAWSAALIVPFLVTLLVTRLLVDLTVRANLDFDEITNFIGGAAFGLVASFITTGIIVLTIEHLPLGKRVLGFEPVEDQNGSLVYGKGLWIPVDKLTVKLYEHLSMGGFGSPDPLALRRPDAWEAAALNNVSYEGKTRASILPDQFTVNGHYRVEGALKALLSDTFSPELVQNIRYTDGSQPPDASSLEGYVITFNSGAKEKKTGQTVIGAGQVRLIVERNGDAEGLHPFAVVAQPDAKSRGMHRFRFDGKDVFVPSVGGKSESAFAFEFIVPKDAKPTALIVKNLSKPVTGIKDVAYRKVADRDKAVLDLTLFKNAGASVAGMESAVLETAGSEKVASIGKGAYPDIEATKGLPWSVVLNVSDKGGMETNAQNEITGGEHQFTKASLANNRTLDRNLRIEKFASGPDVGIVQINVATTGAQSLYGRAMERAQTVAGQPFLVDDQGNRYEAIGYVYDNGKEIKIRFTPGRPIRSMSEVPAVSRSKRDESLRLLFQPTKGVKIVAYALGSKQMAAFEGGGLLVN